MTPGRYWVSAAIDPDDQIVESDETNNGNVFSPSSFEVMYVGTGFPLGTTVATDQPRIIGKAQEVGRFDIEISRFVDGELTSSVSVGWTVRPTSRPAFVD